jgi:hypothetical protein
MVTIAGHRGGCLRDVFAVEISCLEGMVCEACRTINTTIRNARAKRHPMFSAVSQNEKGRARPRWPARYREWPC